MYQPHDVHAPQPIQVSQQRKQRNNANANRILRLMVFSTCFQNCRLRIVGIYNESETRTTIWLL
jgi:hypothetical protein